MMKVMCKIARTAMVDNKPEFIQMLMNHGVKLNKLVREDRLENLYKEVEHFSKYCLL